MTSAKRGTLLQSEDWLLALLSERNGSGACVSIWRVPVSTGQPANCHVSRTQETQETQEF